MQSKNIVDLRDKKRITPQPARREVLALPPRTKDTRRTSPIRKRRQRMRLVLSVVGILFCFGVVYAAHILSYSTQFSVHEVEVQGGSAELNNMVSTFAAAELSSSETSFISRRNILSYDSQPLARDIYNSFPQLASVSIVHSALLSTRLSIIVIERSYYATWCDDSNVCFSLDTTGTVFAPVDQNASSSPGYVFHGAITGTSSVLGQKFAPNHFQQLVAILQSFASSGYTPLGATVINDSDVTIPLTDGSSVKASFGQSPMTLGKNLVLIRTSDALAHATGTLDYVDLRFGDRVYFKLKAPINATSSTSSITVKTKKGH